MYPIQVIYTYIISLQIYPINKRSSFVWHLSCTLGSWSILLSDFWASAMIYYFNVIISCSICPLPRITIIFSISLVTICQLSACFLYLSFHIPLCAFCLSKCNLLLRKWNGSTGRTKQTNKQTTTTKTHCILCFGLQKEVKMLLLFFLASYILLLIKII